MSTRPALCEGNSNQINNGKPNDLSESPKNDAGSEFIINTKECPERIIAQYNIDVEKSCNINRCMRQNKQPKNSKINHCKKRKQEGAANMRQYRSAKASPIEPSIMNTREIIENLVLLHRKEQNAMNSRETIENLMLLDRKKQHSMNTREIIEHLMHPSNS